MAATQLSFIDTPRTSGRITNVASVPQRSPFRYPGGKTWLVPSLRQWLLSLPVRPNEFIEPFAGGAIASLTVAFEKRANHVTFVELDEHVAAVWEAILGEHGYWLADRIAAFEMTPANVESVLAIPAQGIPEKAFQTILRNRVNRGGILAPGAGKVKNGEAGKGLKSRWYPATLKKRIRDIVTLRDQMTFVHGDGLQVMRENLQRTDAVFFIDPPYTAGGKRAGSRLYLHSELDHEELFHLAGKISGDFLLTYDDAPEVRALAQKYGFDSHTIPMKSTHHAEMTELLIGRKLDWAR
jgi:DNA adenine methylase